MVLYLQHLNESTGSKTLVREEGEDDVHVEDGISAPKKRSVMVKTVEKWMAKNDKDSDTSLWLKYVKDG